jgi:hypothetical protein
MNKAFAEEFFTRTQCPAEAAAYQRTLMAALEPELDELVRAFCVSYDHVALKPLVEDVACRHACSEYGVWLAMLILAAESAMPRYRSETYFWNTFTDLRYKAQECYDLHGVWGTFVAVWYPRFYKGTIVALGRLQYDQNPWYGGTTLTVGDTVIQPGEPVIHMHIPSSGEPFDAATRLASYKQAVEYFGRPIVCVCNSWLFYPPYETVFAPTSNIADFRRELQVVSVQEMERCTLWNVIGPQYSQPADTWPEDTTLRRAFKTYAQNGGTFGTAIGLFAFDGERILTKHS